MKNTAKLLLLSAGMLFVSACTDNKLYETSICSLVDISGTYADEKANVARIIKTGIIPKLVPGDSLFFMTIDSNSYNEENMEAKFTLDYRPSEANQQKLAFASRLDDFAAGTESSRHTDISGAMMLCGDYLKSTGAGTQLIFVFSDMLEELPEGITRNFAEAEFADMHIAAMNVIKLTTDSSNPEVYRRRLGDWSQRVSKAGAANWQVILDPTKIPEYIDNLR